MSARARAAAAVLLLVVTVLSPWVAPAAAEDAPDTTAPVIAFNACPGMPAPQACQRYTADVYGDVPVDDDLAMVGARIGDRVLDTYVYNDGTGRVPYGYFHMYGNDVVFDVDWAVQFVVPPGTNLVTFFATDLSGNTTEEDVYLKAATPPGPPHPVAKRTGPRAITVSGVFNVERHGVLPQDAEVRTKGHALRVLRIRVPGFQCCTTYYHLAPGRHDFTVRVKSPAGWSRSTTVHAWIPRKRPA